MEKYFRMLRQELFHRGGFVGRQIVQHDVDFIRPPGLGEQLAQKSDEPGAGVALAVLPFTLPVFQSCI